MSPSRLLTATASELKVYDIFQSYKTQANVSERNLGYTAFTVDKSVNLTPLSKLLIPPPLSHRQVQLESSPRQIDVFGTAFAALCDKFVVFVENIISGQQRKLDLEVDRIALFKLDQWQLATVKNISETEDIVALWTIGDSVTQEWQKTVSKVYAMTTCAKIKFKQALAAEGGNSYYTG